MNLFEEEDLFRSMFFVHVRKLEFLSPCFGGCFGCNMLVRCLIKCDMYEFHRGAYLFLGEFSSSFT